MVLSLPRMVNPIETEMDKAVAEARASMGHDTFDDGCLTEFRVKQKYMGHRNARYNPLPVTRSS